MKIGIVSYTQGPIRQVMLKTALAMIAATLAMTGYNLADTYFVGRLPGTSPLAAMGFTFPVIMLVGCLFRGLTVGVMTTMAQASGAGKKVRASHLVTGGVLLVFLFSILIGATGMLFSNPLFHLFGAEGETLVLVREYMDVWFFGCATASLAMTGNDLLIAQGDSKVASGMMILGMIINVVMDPLFIFGWKFFPAMGLKGAALATIISQCISTVIVLAILNRRHHLLVFKRIPWPVLRSSWLLMLCYAGPTSLGMLLMPAGASIITRITAEFGDVAVAATAAAGRIEMTAFVIPMSLGMSLMPFVGQNFGAKLYDRIREGRRFSMRFATIFLLSAAVLFTIFAEPVVNWFSDDPSIRQLMIEYLRIVSWGLWGVEVHRFSGFFYTGCGRPTAAAWINAMRIVGFLVPSAFIALWMHSLTVLFIGRLVSDLLAGSIGWYLAHRMTNRLNDTGHA